MKVNFTFKHIDHSDSLESYTAEGLEEISRFLLKDGPTHVWFSKHKNEFTVETSLNTNLKFFKASATNQNPYAAVDEVLEKLEKQFLKVAKQHKNHKKPQLAKEVRNLPYRKAA